MIQYSHLQSLQHYLFILDMSRLSLLHNVLTQQNHTNLVAIFIVSEILDLPETKETHAVNCQRKQADSSNRQMEAFTGSHLKIYTHHHSLCFLTDRTTQLTVAQDTDRTCPQLHSISLCLGIEMNIITRLLKQAKHMLE